MQRDEDAIEFAGDELRDRPVFRIERMSVHATLEQRGKTGVTRFE
jgi:hypothetical protein